MQRADSAEVFWDDQKKSWVVRVQVGAEAVRRHCKERNRDAADESLRALALQTARDEGYEVPADMVRVKR